LDYSPPPESRTEFTLEGQLAPRDEVERRLRESVDSFCRTVEKLRSENSYFYDHDLINPALRKYVTQATSVEAARRLWEWAWDARDLVEPESLRAIAHRLFDFGASELGFESLLLAYQRSSEYYSGSHQAQPFLVELCERDRNRLANFLVEHCEGAFRSDYGGFDLPRMIARFFAACGDVPSLRRVFEDYLTHCEELFAFLPKDERYSWLRDYREDGRNESEEILELLVDLIGEPEIEQGRRLVRVLANLAKARADLVCRICCHRLATGEPILRERLEALLDALAWICPGELAPYLEPLLPLFKEPHFRLRMMLIGVICRVGASASLARSVIAAADEAKRAYSPIIGYPSRRFLHAEPSTEFMRFVKRGTLFDFYDRLKGVSELLRMDPPVILSHLERTLRSSGWNEIEEERRLKSDWEGNARDNRVVWIVPGFHIRISDLLQAFVHQAVENGRYDAKILFGLTNVVRGSDPEFVSVLPRTKPLDIRSLSVTDCAAWLD